MDATPLVDDTQGLLGSFSILSTLLIAAAVWLVFWVLNGLRNVRKQIAKAKDIKGYWQILDGSLVPIPILAPHIAHGFVLT